MNRLTSKDINWYEDFVFSMRNRLITENVIKDYGVTWGITKKELGDE